MSDSEESNLSEDEQQSEHSEIELENQNEEQDEPEKVVKFQDLVNLNSLYTTCIAITNNNNFYFRV